MPAAASSPPRSGAPSLIDPSVLMTIRSLELRARAVVEGFWSGLHRSPWHGFSVEFTEYRQYTPGDDPRHLDWRVFARTDRFYLRKFEDETNLRCHLAVDQSRSMDYGSRGWTKAEYAATLAATFAYFLHLQGDATGLLTFDEQVRDYLPARHRPGHLRHLMLALEKPAGGASTDVTAPLRRLVEIVRKRGMMVLISDFLAPPDRLERSLSTVTAAGHEVAVFQVLDPEEVTFDFPDAGVFEDAETGRTMFIDPDVVRKDYLERFGRHQEALRGICRKLGIPLARLRTDEPMELALFAFLQERLRGGRRVRRNRGPGS